MIQKGLSNLTIHGRTVVFGVGIEVALLYGTLGYIVGRIFRAVGSRVSSHDRDATH